MKAYILKLGLLTAMLSAILSAYAYDFEVDGIYYNITSMADLEVEVTYKYVHHVYDTSSQIIGGTNNSYEGDIRIPETVNYNNKTYTVTSIGEEAFGLRVQYLRLEYNGSKITSITLPNTLKSIKSYAFAACEDLVSVRFPKELISIDSYAFWCCSIENVESWGGVETIGERAFTSTALTSLYLPESTNEVGNYAFASNPLTQVILGKNLRKVGNAAFSQCNKLVEVFCTSESLPEGMSLSTFSNSHSALEIYVPSTSIYGFGREYLTFPERTFDYTGQPHNIEWSNNLKAYKCQIDPDDSKTFANAGEYTKYLKATYSDGVDFTVEIPYEYVINKAPLSLTVNNIEREYGDENPAFTCNISGFVNGENESVIGSTPSFECEATRWSKVGSYRILASLDAPNYEVTYKYGTLNIVKAPLTVGVNDATKIYGNENPDFTLSFTGLKNGETVPDWVNKPTFATSATTESSTGTYQVTASNGEAVNYEISKYNPGNLTIAKRDLTAKANDCERSYDEENPVFDISYIGFVNNDTPESFIEIPTVTCSAIKTSNAGTYPLVVSGGEAQNYNFVYQDGTLTINPLTVGFKEVYNSVTYNDMSISTSDTHFNYIPEIIGPFSSEDFDLQLWFLDKDNKYPQHVIYISGGDYAGDYVSTNYDRTMWAGKYIFNLIPTGNNPNVVANPSRAYLTVNRASNNLEWDADSPIILSVGEKVDLGITYQSDLWCEFDTTYNDELIELSSYGAIGNDPHWYATGLNEGETTLYFSISCKKNDMGFYDFSDSSTLSKRIIVNPRASVNGISDSDDITVLSNNQEILILNKPSSLPVYLFNLQGTLLNSTTADRIQCPDKGIHIVKVGDKVLKVVTK